MNAPAPASVRVAHAAEFVLRRPTVSDGALIWRLVCDSGVLEPNSCYAYLLFCSHFADTCLVAERAGDVIGFVVAYRPPTRPDAVFVWQIGVRADARGLGLGKRLLHHLMELPNCHDASFLEATVTKANVASQRLFLGFAKERDLPCEVTTGFTGADFGQLAHEDEDLYRIGPSPSRSHV
jgi:L-2,4-diaminobutyric acid acetyltransferase